MFILKKKKLRLISAGFDLTLGSKYMRTLTALAVAAALSFGVTAAYASQSEGGFSIGVKGGYNDMSVPTASQTYTDIFNGDTVNVSEKKDKYMADIHVAYLWPVADTFQLGGQLGYSYYGKYKTTVTEGSDSTEATAKFFDPNLQLVGQWNIQQWFLQARAGVGYFKPTVSNGSDNDVTYETKSTWDPVAGISGGYFFTDNFSAEVFYDHVFGTNYNSASNLNSDTSNKPPTMNSAGIGITYSF